jgi:alpha-tubulin suppressor-like RCC1 family protein
MGWPVLGRGQTTFDPAFNLSLQRIGTDTNWISVSAGSDHNLALKSDGTLWAWGSGLRGQLGDGKSGGAHQLSTPTQTAAGNDWAQVVAGSVCSYSVKKDGSLWAWGLNNFCQLGIGSTKDSARPVRVGVSTNWVKIAAGGVSAAGIQRDGSLWIWGGSPQLGNTGPASSQNDGVPTRITLETNWSDVAVAFNTWLGVTSNGTLWAWGRNAHVFTGASTNACGTPTQVGTNTHWQACASSSGGFSHLLREQDGSFWLLSAPDFTHASLQLHPIQLPDDIVVFGFGGYSGGYRGGTGIAITREGEVWTWGTVLGQRSARERVRELLESLGRRIGLKTGLSPKSNVTVREEPWPLHLKSAK